MPGAGGPADVSTARTYEDSEKKHGSRRGFWETGAWQRKSGSWKGGYLREKPEDALKKIYHHLGFKSRMDN